MTVAAFAQKSNNEEKRLTKYEELCSQTGGMIKIQDVALPKFKTSDFGIQLEASVRLVMKGNSDFFFFRIEKPETSSSIARIAMIEYPDLVEINKALALLSNSIDADLDAHPDYLENKFSANDGIEIGYYIKRNYQSGKWDATWFIKLDRYSGSVVSLRTTKDVLESFAAAQAKMEELMAQR